MLQYLILKDSECVIISDNFISKINGEGYRISHNIFEIKANYGFGQISFHNESNIEIRPINIEVY